MGFTTKTQLGDVWSSKDDGKTWAQLTPAPAFSARSGHGVVRWREGVRGFFGGREGKLMDQRATPCCVENSRPAVYPDKTQISICGELGSLVW